MVECTVEPCTIVDTINPAGQSTSSFLQGIQSRRSKPGDDTETLPASSPPDKQADISYESGLSDHSVAEQLNLSPMTVMPARV